MKSSSIGPSNIRYELLGDQGKPLILFLHGFMGSRDDWRPLAQALSDRFASLLIDLPGHGESTFPDEDDYGAADLCADLVEIIDDLDYATFNVVGYSMGGRIALYFASVYAMRMDALVIESASPGIEDATDRNSRRKADDALTNEIEQGDFAEFLNRWYRQPIFASLQSRPDLLREAVASKSNGDPKQLAKALRAFGPGAMPPVWRELAVHTMPTLVITGELDSKYTALAAEMALRCPAMTTLTVPHAGHNVHLEAPDAYTTGLREFLVNHVE